MQEYDVLIVGAGLSGIGAAYHLKQQCPGSSFHILEARERIGGTWDLFRYPGIRSDSDMYTLGYEFKPWLGGKVLADGPSIRDYVCETAEENGIVPHISFGMAVKSANWSSEEKRWTLRVETGGEELTFRCRLLLTCAGYYRYDKGHMPEYPGANDFKGELFHPQHWPEALDYAGKNVVIIGSGATAVTLVPAMADTAANVTMLQRTPSYMVNRPQFDFWEKVLSPFLPSSTVFKFIRWKNANLQRMVYVATRIAPSLMKKLFLSLLRKQLPEGYDIDKHFTPDYNPWDQRLCAVPDNDIFEAISAGKAQIVTDEIAQFTQDGIALKSGDHLPADIVVSATGLRLAVNGEVAFSKDGEPIDFADTWSYQGMMFSGVPNLINTYGYLQASWTLRADLIANFACKVLNRLDAQDDDQVVPTLRDSDKTMEPRPWIDNFPAGYIQRSIHRFPKQGDRSPWMNTQNYRYEKRAIGNANLDDGVLVFS